MAKNKEAGKSTPWTSRETFSRGENFSEQKHLLSFLFILNENSVAKRNVFFDNAISQRHTY